VNTFSPVDFDLTSSLRFRFLFLLQITTSAQQRTVYSFLLLPALHFTRSFAVLSVMSADKGILRCKDTLALSTHLHVSLPSHFSLHPIFAMPGIGSEALQRSVLAAFTLGLPCIFFHSFILIRSSLHFTLHHSLIVAPVGAVRSRTWSTGQPAVERSHAVPAFIACFACHNLID
jgi:hypothetical protein